jgi:hypothetical protein
MLKASTKTRGKEAGFTLAHHRIRLIKAELTFLDSFPECCSSFRQGPSFHAELEAGSDEHCTKAGGEKFGVDRLRSSGSSFMNIRLEIQTSTRGEQQRDKDTETTHGMNMPSHASHCLCKCAIMRCLKRASRLRAASVDGSCLSRSRDEALTGSISRARRHGGLREWSETTRTTAPNPLGILEPLLEHSNRVLKPEHGNS